MSISRRIALMLSMTGAALMAACASPPPRVYTLAPVPGVPQSGTPRIVLVHQPAIAHYLDRPDIVRSSENFRLDVMANDIWGEPLAAMIGRVLTEDLSRRLPRTTFLNAAGAISAKEEATVDVNIDRMDIDASQLLAFAAQVAVTFANGKGSETPRSFRTSVPVSANTTTAEVQAMSIALGQLADQIAEMLRQPSASRRGR